MITQQFLLPSGEKVRRGDTLTLALSLKGEGIWLTSFPPENYGARRE